MLGRVGFFDRLRGSWSLVGVHRPWDPTASILAHLQRHTLPGGRLDDAALPLGDEALQEPNRLRWAAGALDGVFGHHVNLSTDGERVAELAGALVALLSSATAENLRELYRLATRDALLGIVDRLTDRLRDTDDINPGRVHALGEVLAREAPHREAVKLGLALIGSVEADDTELILALGVHDEFTLFAGVALVNQNREQSELALFQLAARVDGWGRIQVVERLTEPSRPEVRAWLLREGFRNSVMDEYLAYTCAMAGRLHEALAAPEVEPALLRGAAGILRALAHGGPAQDLADYPHAEAAVSAFLRHAERSELDLEHLAALDALSMRPEPSESLRKRITVLRASPAARALIDAGLDSTDPATFQRADAAAGARGIPTFSRHEARVKEGHLALSLPALLRSADSSNIERALSAVAPHLPLTRISSGATLEAGFGLGFELHAQLELVVQELARFAGAGAAFLEAALASPVVQNRSTAVRVLASWTKPHWPASSAAALEQAITREPSADLRCTMERVRDGRAFEEPEEDDDLGEDDEPSDSTLLLH